MVCYFVSFSVTWRPLPSVVKLVVVKSSSFRLSMLISEKGEGPTDVKGVRDVRDMLERC
jgi:hypothetical protein